jgi:hypothetical protein
LRQRSASFALRDAEVDKQYKAGVADCTAKFPEDRAHIMAFMQCVNDVIARTWLPVSSSNADLWQNLMAYNMSVAEQIQNGQVTNVQGVALMAQKFSEVVTEARRRDALAQ